MMNTDKKYQTEFLLEDSRLKENPFSLPENYFSLLEQQVHEKIHPALDSSPFILFVKKTKSYAYLALSFLIVFGIGYGILSLTSTLSEQSVEQNDIFSLIEDGYLSSSFIENYYEDIAVEELFLSSLEMKGISEEDINTTIEESIREQDLIEYLGIDIPESYNSNESFYDYE